MSPERLRQIEELFHAVREGSAERQAALLARADPELRREVESLLGRQSENLFLDRAAVEASAQSPDDSACSMLSAGTFLGPYRVEGKLGEGGMGEVYRARDTRLKRDVAVKVLPRTFARDTDRCARFRREAELLATLNHPHIAAVYGLEEAGDLTALVLELVEGPTLADRLTEGAVPLDEALAIARQIAEAFEAAHEKGIIHRDLKPANIKVRPDGTVKVLDFGLAKSLEPTGAPSILSELPSTALSPAPTLAGMILGTPAYMSPEQARGRAVDERTDIWAFGCVLYEMLTGKKPFPGETVTDIVAAIINNEPDWQALPHRTPERIQSLIARCLRKDPAQRLRDIADGRFQIEEVLNDPRASTAAVTQARICARVGGVGRCGAVSGHDAVRGHAAFDHFVVTRLDQLPRLSAGEGRVLRSNELHVRRPLVCALTRRPCVGVQCGDAGRPTHALAAISGSRGRAAAGRNRGRPGSVLVPGQSLDWLLRQRNAPEDSRRRRSRKSHPDHERHPRCHVGYARDHSSGHAAGRA